MRPKIGNLLDNQLSLKIQGEFRINCPNSNPILLLPSNLDTKNNQGRNIKRVSLNDPIDKRV